MRDQACRSRICRASGSRFIARPATRIRPAGPVSAWQLSSNSSIFTRDVFTWHAGRAAHDSPSSCQVQAMQMLPPSVSGRLQPERNVRAAPLARILVIEDNEDLAFGLRNNLEIEGYRVELATDGPSGLSRAREVQPDLIVLDLMLPSLDGYHVLRELRAEGNAVPVVILTARTEE